MTGVSFTREALWEGRRRLARLLPAAEAELAADPDRWQSMGASAVMLAQAPYCRADNLEALVVHPGELGGYVCDVVLKRVPAAVAAIFGTPVHAPFPTKAEAEAAAPAMLSMALTMARNADLAAEQTGRAPPRVFDYFDHAVELAEPLMRKLEALAAAMPHMRYNSVERAMERLDDLTNELFPDGRVTTERLNALSHDHHTLLLSRLAMASLDGVFRYPERRAEPPGKFAPIEIMPQE